MDTISWFVIGLIVIVFLPALAALSERRYRERERKEISTLQQTRRWTQWGCYDGTEYRSARKQ